MAHWRVHIDYGPEDFLIEAPGEDEAREKAWNDAIEQLVINTPEEVEVAKPETPAYEINKDPQRMTAEFHANKVPAILPRHSGGVLRVVNWVDVRPE